MTKRNITMVGIVLILLAAAGITIIGSLSNETPQSIGTLQARPLTVDKFNLQQASLALPLLDESPSTLASKPELGRMLQLKNTLKLGLRQELKQELKAELTAGLKKLDRTVDLQLKPNSLTVSLSQSGARLGLSVLLKELASPSGLCDNCRELLDA
jgi:hypothetical protein